MAQALKFVHASDFSLDQPLQGLGNVPKHLKLPLVNAPYKAAERVFDLAVSEKADFVLLAGGVVDLEAGGPRAISFLLHHFQRLAEAGIAVYWCGGQIDLPDRWPAVIDLPANVTTFTSTIVQPVVHRRAGKPIATIYGAAFESRQRDAGNWRAAADEPFPIALTAGQIDPDAMSAQNIQYWALGGQPQRQVVERTGTIVVYPGTVQGRHRGQIGPHGCTLVQVDVAGKIRLAHRDYDPARWLPQQLEVAEDVSLDDLKQLLADRALQVAAATPDQVALVHWQITPTGAVNPRLRSRAWHEQLLGWLRSEFGQGAHGVWSVDLQIEPPKNLPSDWYEEDTILGDFLREVGRLQSDSELPLGLHEYLPATLQDESMAAIARLNDEQRQNLLQQAALVGVDYLSPNAQEDLPEE